MTSSPNLPTAGRIRPSFGGGLFDGFVAKIDASGTRLAYSTYLGGSGDDRAYRIAVDASGAAYVAGETDSTNFPTARALQPTPSGWCARRFACGAARPTAAFCS